MSDVNAGGRPMNFATETVTKTLYRYKDSVLVSDGTGSGMSVECIEGAMTSARHGPRVGHVNRGLTTLWPRSRPFGAGNFRRSWPKTAKLATTPATIGRCAHP